MGLLFNRKKSEDKERAIEKQSYIEVTELKNKTHESANQANKELKKLNDLLKANGITLKIHIAAGGKRNGH